MIDLLFMLEQIVPNMKPSTGRKKLNVHAARDGTAAGRYGGAPRDHLNLFKKLYLICFVSSVFIK